MRAAFQLNLQKTGTTERNDGSSSPSQVVAGGSRSLQPKLNYLKKIYINKWGIHECMLKMKVTKSEGDYTTTNIQQWR